jgi:hypothetical protein
MSADQRTACQGGVAIAGIPQEIRESAAPRRRRRCGLHFAGHVPMELERVVCRVREEFREMPGLRLTPAQATRLWGLEYETCRVVIERLVASDYLRWTAAGLVTRVES